MDINSFKSKAALGRYIKAMLKETEPGDNLRLDDKTLLYDLIEWHPSAEEKIGIGIKNIVVRADPKWKKSKGFFMGIIYLTPEPRGKHELAR